MGFLKQPPTAQLIAEKRQLLIKTLADFIDTRGSQILDILRAKDEVDKMPDKEVDSITYGMLECWAADVTAPYRTFYPEDIEQFRKEYDKLLAIHKDVDKEKVKPLIAEKYTDEYILQCLSQGDWAVICLSHDLNPYIDDWHIRVLHPLLITFLRFTALWACYFRKISLTLQVKAVSAAAT